MPHKDIEEITDDILLDMCVNPKCQNPEEHAQYKPIIKQRILDLLSSTRTKTLGEVEAVLPVKLENLADQTYGVGDQALRLAAKHPELRNSDKARAGYNIYRTEALSAIEGLKK